MRHFFGLKCSRIAGDDAPPGPDHINITKSFIPNSHTIQIHSIASHATYRLFMPINQSINQSANIIGNT
jgi:hypothetical protein